MAFLRKKKVYLCFLIWCAVLFHGVFPAVSDPSIQEIQIKKLNGNKIYFVFITKKNGDKESISACDAPIAIGFSAARFVFGKKCHQQVSIWSPGFGSPRINT